MEKVQVFTHPILNVVKSEIILPVRDQLVEILIHYFDNMRFLIFLSLQLGNFWLERSFLLFLLAKTDVKSIYFRSSQDLPAVR